MKLHRLIGTIAVAVPLGALAAVALVVPLAAQHGRNGQLRVVKDCGTFSGIPGSSFCTILTSNLRELPAGTQIYYNQITAGPSAGPGYLDSNVFVFVNTSQWAVGRCTVPNNKGPGICTLSDGFGPLAGITARINVTYRPPDKPGDSAFLYTWDGTYKVDPTPDR